MTEILLEVVLNIIKPTNQPITNNTHIFKKTMQRLVIFGIRTACPGRYRDYCCSNKQQSIFNLACKKFEERQRGNPKRRRTDNTMAKKAYKD